MAYINLNRILRIGQIMGTRMLLVGVILSFGYRDAIANSIDIGIVKINSKNEWYLFTTRKISQSDGVVVQFPQGNIVGCCVKARPIGGSKEQMEPIVTDEFKDGEVWSYKLKPSLPAEKSRPFVGIAIVGDIVYTHRDGNLIRSRNGSNEVNVSSCLGSEGLHVLAREGVKLRAHLYLNLGYSISSNCTEEMLE